MTGAARRRLELAGREFDRHSAKAIDAALKAQRELLAFIRREKELSFKRVLELRRTLDA